MPSHVAIIMDGNGRWAQKRGLPRAAGHRAGVEAVRPVIQGCIEQGVKYLTLFAFSTENWKRPRDEVAALMGLLTEYFHREVDALAKKDIRIRIIGDRSGLQRAVLDAIQYSEAKTRGNNGLVLTMAFNYGGRREICRAAREIASLAAEGRIEPSDIDEDLFASHLYTGGIPDPDLLIRPSGEMRLSNFLLWQCAYTEFWFTPVLWPDFGKSHLLEAISAYRSRRRRYGGLGSPAGR